MLTPKEVAAVREELLSCSNPLFLYHDDPDGLASFLLCYRFVKEGRGLPVKAFPRIGVEPFARKAEEFSADKVFVLDVAMVDQEFIDAVNVPVVWVDHHVPLERDNVRYFNPQVRGVNVPTPVLIWQVMGGDRPQDLWLAVAGAVGDWHLPSFAEEFQQAYPELLPRTCATVEEALFDTTLGVLVKVFSFNLKGPMKDVLAAVKTLTRVDSPYEVLEQQTPGGKFLWKRFEKINRVYEEMLADALKVKPKQGLFVYTYEGDKLSLTKDLANELLYKLKTVIIVGREKSGEVRCSLRSPPDINIAAALEKALVGVEGYGGGHPQACGAAVKKEDFAPFLDALRKELKRQ